MQVLEIQPRDLDDKQAIAESKIDPTFRKLTKNAVCFHIWKVESDRIESVPKTQYGTFYDDCTYIIYAAAPKEIHINQDTITRELKNTTQLDRFIHFWLGSETTPQKSGNVAYKVMELDTHFGNMATLYRETQDNESSRFLSYFKKRITVFSGALMEDPSNCRLYQAKGKTCLICTEKTTVNWEHFNSECIMILRTPKYIFVWIGRASSSTERRNALDLAEKFQDEFCVPELTIVDDGYEQSMNAARKREWNQYLCLKSRFVHQVNHVGQSPKPFLKLYKCGYLTGKYRIEEVKTTPPDQADLNDSTAAYIIDGISLGVWVWVGRLADKQEKVEAMRNARGFVKKKKYPSMTPVVRVVENHEPVEFTRLFNTWQFSDCNRNKFSKILGKLDSLTLLQRPKMAADTQLIDDGTGERHLFRITNGQYIELPQQKHTIFFSNECYIIHYCITYLDSMNTGNINDVGIKYVVYFWYGKNTTSETRHKAEILAYDYFENLGKHSMITKIAEGLETPHFLQIFNGRFMIFKDYDTILPQTFALRVYGDSSCNAKAVQTDSQLIFSPKSCFVIKSFNTWIWCGQSSTGDAREVAKNIASILGEYTLVVESKEPEEFWKSVSDDFDCQHLNEVSDLCLYGQDLDTFDKTRAGLYMSYYDRGIVMLKEITAYDQSDLTPEDIFLLDIGNMIFVWVGSLSDVNERDICWPLAKDYLHSFPVARNINTAVAVLRQGQEPNIFVGCFDSWDAKFWKSHITYEATRRRLETSVSPITNLLYAVSNGESDFDKFQKYPLSVLQQEADLLPTGVNPIKKEIHLTHDDFVSVFNMRYSEFDSLPGWKKQELKKKYKLF